MKYEHVVLCKQASVLKNLYMAKLMGGQFRILELKRKNKVLSQALLFVKNLEEAAGTTAFSKDHNIPA